MWTLHKEFFRKATHEPRNQAGFIRFMGQTAEQLNSVAQPVSRPPVMWQIVERVEKDATIKMIKFPEVPETPAENNRPSEETS